MKLSAALVSLATVAAAAPSGAPSPLNVQLHQAGNSLVKAVVKNTGSSDLKVFKRGSIFDTELPTEKVKVLGANGQPLEFKGIKVSIDKRNLGDADFQHIRAGQTVEVTFDVAQTHDLQQGGAFSMLSSGVLEFAQNNQLVGSVPFASNTLASTIDGAAVASAPAVLKRTNLQSDCTGSRLSTQRLAESNCAKLASAAGEAASSGPASKMEEFFKSSTASVRKQVASVFSKVAGECTSSGGVSKTYCTDVANHCSGRILAYTSPSQSYQAYCDLYWNDLTDLTSSCHRQDKATTVLHETTHLRQIAGTDDLGYGYDNIRKLSTQDSLNNADSYAVFANSIYAGC